MAESVYTSPDPAPAGPKVHHHFLEVEISSGYPHGLRGDIAFMGVCDAPEGSPCRMWCDEPGCWEEAQPDHAEHPLRDQGECGAIGNLNADPGFIPELYSGPKAPLRPGPIRVVQDCDGVTWSYIDSPGACGASCRHECPECRLGLGSHLPCDPRCEQTPQAETRAQ